MWQDQARLECHDYPTVTRTLRHKTLEITICGKLYESLGSKLRVTLHNPGILCTSTFEIAFETPDSGSVGITYRATRVCQPNVNVECIGFMPGFSVRNLANRLQLTMLALVRTKQQNERHALGSDIVYFATLLHLCSSLDAKDESRPAARKDSPTSMPVRYREGHYRQRYDPNTLLLKTKQRFRCSCQEWNVSGL